MQKLFLLLAFSLLLLGCVQQQEPVQLSEKQPAMIGEATTPPKPTFIATPTITTQPTTQAPTATAQPTPQATPTQTPAMQVQEFEMIAKQWEFLPNKITVKKGVPVKIRVTSTDVTHGLSLPSFGINERLETGQTVDIEFTPQQIGEFSFTCSVFCGSGHGKMFGLITVTE
ncbi:MAG: cupredoxin domain-containing protein [Candidatus Micrarchaeia archaeon]